MMYSIMHRTQLLLHDWQYAALKARAAREGKSLSALVREIVSAHLDRKASKLDLIEGIAEGPPDFGAEHDRYLYGDE